MLVLTRKKSQLIQIGDNIVIKIIRTSPGSVKIGIDAPSDVRVMRGELDEVLSRNYDAPVSSKSRSLENSAVAEECLTASSTETVVAESRLGELADDDEPICLADYLAQKTVLA